MPKTIGTMNDFSEMRRLAREKRDATISEAKREYTNTLEQINDLKKRITQKPPIKGRPKPLVPMRVKVMDAVHQDRTWTVYDVLKWLELPETDKGIVRATLDKMRHRGDIRRIRRGRNSVPALFAVADYGPEDLGLKALSQIEAAMLVMRQINKPMTTTQIVLKCLNEAISP